MHRLALDDGTTGLTMTLACVPVTWMFRCVSRAYRRMRYSFRRRVADCSSSSEGQLSTHCSGVGDSDFGEYSEQLQCSAIPSPGLSDECACHYESCQHVASEGSAPIAENINCASEECASNDIKMASPCPQNAVMSSDSALLCKISSREMRKREYVDGAAYAQMRILYSSSS